MLLHDLVYVSLSPPAGRREGEERGLICSLNNKTRSFVGQYHSRLPPLEEDENGRLSRAPTHRGNIDERGKAAAAAAAAAAVSSLGKENHSKERPSDTSLYRESDV